MSLVYPIPRHPPGRRGFTMVEVLTAVSIICILTGLLIPIIGAVQRQAKKARSLILFNNVANAFNDYKREYGRFPIFKELDASATPWPTNKGEVDTSFQLNDGDAILRQVLTADNAYLASVSNPGAINYNRNGIRFLELDETFLCRDRVGTSASSVNPWIMDGFDNPFIGMVVHTGTNQEIDSGAFSTAKPVTDSEDDPGALLPAVVHNIPQTIAIYSLVVNLNDDSVNSTWVTNWPYAQYNK
jgi:prepilin-type N-terminal cleavage/methylation domain-containing protein